MSDILMAKDEETLTRKKYWKANKRSTTPKSYR
jgi:hypothetical protein